MNKFTVQRKTLAYEVYKHLYNKIITLDYKPGQMIYESTIAEELGLSRTPVREAIHLLSSEGFLQIIPQKGIRVKYISKKKVQEALQVRKSLEAVAFREAAGRWNESESQVDDYKADLRHIMDQQRDAAKTQDVITFYHYDEVFHDKILEICGNQTLGAVVRQVRGHVNRIRYLEFFETREMDRVIHDHEELITLIQSNDSDGVARRLNEHLDTAARHYSDIMEKYADYFEAQT
ncbi:GntR family transcriptional regulator [Terribacillus saccharophilus]|uniref:GntR family transcriptional regulator n=1 Tax=Terribacillus saccharophilus TaxID=361277 RepID=UPI0014736118|nr:GntR family transcriptional regulator [Terribacillus goriensis]